MIPHGCLRWVVVAFVGDKELAALAGFRERYELQTYPMSSGRKLKLYVRRDGKGLRP